MKNIPCHIIECPANYDLKCEKHSAIIIEETGYCQTGLEQMKKKKKYGGRELKRSVELTAQEIKLVHRILTERKDEIEHKLIYLRKASLSTHGTRVTGQEKIVKKLSKVLRKMEKKNESLGNKRHRQ